MGLSVSSSKALKTMTRKDKKRQGQEKFILQTGYLVQNNPQLFNKENIEKFSVHSPQSKSKVIASLKQVGSSKVSSIKDKQNSKKNKNSKKIVRKKKQRDKQQQLSQFPSIQFSVSEAQQGEILQGNIIIFDKDEGINADHDLEKIEGKEWKTPSFIRLTEGQTQKQQIKPVKDERFSQYNWRVSEDEQCGLWCKMISFNRQKTITLNNKFEQQSKMQPIVVKHDNLAGVQIKMRQSFCTK